ncbi:hypothetical protein BLNAU_22899 [Blattamonas nauphoetae]|uniref:Uncharacterized protein n=1 Tax=Blattamonas nauphoetae TaxID=2049346 RepID=A0ABQ9WUU1_9EUKA|nr:hypothetical protein BLNAU_22899 [Blattamonas nauphoetae]
MNRSSYYLFRFCNDLFRSSCTFGLFVSLLQNWQLTLTGIKSFVHIFYSLLHTKDPAFTPLPLKWFFDLAHTLLDGKKALPLLPFSTLLQRRLANEVCGAGEVDLCVLTLSSLLTNTHVAVTQSNQESGEGSWCVVDQKATRDKEERKCV